MADVDGSGGIQRRIRHLVVDRDGVLNVEDPAARFTDPASWRWIPGSRAALAAFLRSGVVVSVVTNQSSIGRGEQDGADLEALHRSIAEDLRSIAGAAPSFHVCPHTYEAGCGCRKPEPGLVLEAVRTSCVDPADTLVVGDDVRDLEAGRRAGVATALVLTGKGSSIDPEALAGHPVYDDLWAVARDVGVVAGPLTVEGVVDDPLAMEFHEHAELVGDTLASVRAPLEELAHRLARTFRSGGKLLVVGNGGSAADASHFAAELVTGSGDPTRSLPAVVPAGDVPALTAMSNDFGFEDAWARSVRALASPGDVLIAISTSGRSPNVLEAARAARSAGCGVAALTGAGGHSLSELADISVVVPSRSVQRIQEMHALCLHALASLVWREVGSAS